MVLYFLPYSTWNFTLMEGGQKASHGPLVYFWSFSDGSLSTADSEIIANSTRTRGSSSSSFSSLGYPSQGTYCLTRPLTVWLLILFDFSIPPSFDLGSFTCRVPDFRIFKLQTPFLENSPSFVSYCLKWNTFLCMRSAASWKELLPSSFLLLILS